MSEVFRFSCTACGACCNSPPSLYLNELLEQSAHFVLIPTFMFGYKVGPKDEHLRRSLAQRTGVDPGKDPEAFEQSVRTFTAESVAYGAPFPGGRNGEVLKIPSRAWTLSPASRVRSGRRMVGVSIMRAAP